jgi:hypothetical protein
VVPSFKVIVLGKLEDLPSSTFVPVVTATLEVESDTPSPAIDDIAASAP